ncbi:hypothetical protein J0A68_09430 [Algoriphagus sp. H41]|uniref:Uncharacterized protein n=1 Tax=Algoriphagus oliviformis TaxID=2811231 RepID=A0ABS3C236_9BACT|nr:hypothetical protein [Algoriphagus oliviformis]MBN7811178.1 hypothetical protein [Algoriphagus oliviformis]
MKIDRPFNQLSRDEYRHFIEHHADYSDFNTLGLYRSICENESLDLAARIEVRDFANRFFEKTFEFLQVKDPRTYFELSTLGEELTKADAAQIWREIRINQERILADKKIKHRNFGEYSRHNCGHPGCPFDGMMIRQDSWLTEYHMHFVSDRTRDGVKAKSARFKKERKTKNWRREEE